MPRLPEVPIRADLSQRIEISPDSTRPHPYRGNLRLAGFGEASQSLSRGNVPDRQRSGLREIVEINISGRERIQASHLG